MDYVKLGTRVRQQRVLNRLTQEQLAEKTGVSTSFIGHIERGEKKASMETVVALCNAMSVAPSVLLQDSLSDEVMRSQLAFNKENEELVNGLMQVLREHTQKSGGY
ncbi:MAG: helix-turn-helix transcriptional regulator [Clostridia bacterium]|nr:helix-turn-helix transcriptional regulator [Clostridia bacterium]